MYIIKEGGDTVNIKLKDIIYLNRDTQGSLADALGISPCRLSHKIHGKDNGQFTQREIKAIIERYKLSAEEVMDIFFKGE
jgi:hypothetical protein